MRMRSNNKTVLRAKPRLIFLDRDPDMPTTWWGWVGAGLLVLAVLIIPNLL
jgi:hypothetical protein